MDGCTPLGAHLHICTCTPAPPSGLETFCEKTCSQLLPVPVENSRRSEKKARIRQSLVEAANEAVGLEQAVVALGQKVIASLNSEEEGDLRWL